MTPSRSEIIKRARTLLSNNIVKFDPSVYGYTTGFGFVASITGLLYIATVGPEIAESHMYPLHMKNVLAENGFTREELAVAELSVMKFTDGEIVFRPNQLVADIFRKD